MAIVRSLDCRRLALRAWRTMAQLCYAAKFDPFLSLDCAPCPPPWRNPRKGRDKILPSGNLAAFSCHAASGASTNEPFSRTRRIWGRCRGGRRRRRRGGGTFWPRSAWAGARWRSISRSSPTWRTHAREFRITLLRAWRCLLILQGRTQAGPGRKIKHEQEEISSNHVQAFSGASVQCKFLFGRGCVNVVS